jgi:DNA adenine methylase
MNNSDVSALNKLANNEQPRDRVWISDPQPVEHIVRPFLKWPGGKHRLLPRICAVLPPGQRLIEPFAGSCAVSLGTEYPRYLLADANHDIINLYLHLKRERQSFIDYCCSFFQETYNRAEIYYALRALFNETSDLRLKAALFVYLNRHTYNGLCRYNAQGQFNAPFGRYKLPYFPEAEMQTFIAKAKQVTFLRSDFVETMQRARRGDVVYCDPPYTPLSETANFTDYSTGGFGVEDQETLAELAEQLARRGIPVVISNHDTPFIRELYANARIEAFQVQRYISQDILNRRKAAEVLAIFS